jgi:hypothetical protein
MPLILLPQQLQERIGISDVQGLAKEAVQADHHNGKSING